MGESESNGRVENAIRRAQEKIRAVRHHVEANMKCQIFEETLIMAWMARWSAELISKYVVGENGKTSYERFRGEDCVTPLVPFGETVMYLPLKSVHRNKGMPAKRTGIWFGVRERIEEVLIGTTRGVVKCRTVGRLGDTERWNKHNILGMAGTPWELVPGKDDHHIPVDIADNGDFMGRRVKTKTNNQVKRVMKTTARITRAQWTSFTYPRKLSKVLERRRVVPPAQPSKPEGMGQAV